MHDVIARADTRQRIAEQILDELDLVNLWSRFGTCNLVGAVAYHLVVAPDIDMEIFCPVLRIEDGFDIIQTCALHPKVKKTYYPGLASHRHHELAKKLMSGFGGVVTCELDTDLKGTLRFMDTLRLCQIGPSLGGAEALATHPATMSYYKQTPEERADLGILDELVRLAVGLEDPEDIISDLAQALDQIEK